MTDTPVGWPQSVAQRAGLHMVFFGLLGLTVLTDAIPPRIRFGRWNDLLGRLAFGDALPTIPPGAELWRHEPSPKFRPAADISCLIVAGALDTGGVEMVVAALGEGLPNYGIETEIAYTEEGRISSSLRERGVRVTLVPDSQLAGFVNDRRPDTIQLHRVGRGLFGALAKYASRTVPVFHAMESYLNRPTWAEFAEFVRASATSIAVSSPVAEYFNSRLNIRSEVVVNGVAAPVGDLLARHEIERRRLAEALGIGVAPNEIFVVALQRFSDQKNPAGLVDAFLLAAETNRQLRLVIAGAPSSWLEVRRADALRRMHPDGNRVHFLGDSDPAALLIGGDLFAIDSFAEGGPMAAVEALSCGLPVVLSDVGFARGLVHASQVPGRVVSRANPSMESSSVASQRRRRHQSNRAEFAEALLDISAAVPRRVFGPPEGFSRESMISGHARILKEVAALHD